ncbi:hypothetical protein BDV29DRAFT_175511 [Aspergillus leporis]|uniref:Uncharacterized protein n=1 Tax=Aspergillus leporis TaxID=41062 RepID=A0A5N5X080_9EURO|nr:hypothetical protein BDV29DRAFT_175511 [Aspergillus leporis]
MVLVGCSGPCPRQEALGYDLRSYHSCFTTFTTLFGSAIPASLSGILETISVILPSSNTTPMPVTTASLP